MPWLQVETVAPQTEPRRLEDALSELGAVAVWLRDGGDEPVLEPAPGETPGWSDTLVTALYTDDFTQETLAPALAARLPDIEFHFSIIEDRDWQAEFQNTVTPLQFAEHLWVIPDGAAPPPDATVIRLMPGMAFGSGEHPTTAMCMRWLAQQPLAGMQTLDYGCGSGLLAIAALKLGAASACGVDIDPQALQATGENATKNGCAERLTIVKPDAVPAGAKYDVLVANILSGTLIDLGSTLNALTKPGGRIALTGILEHQANDVVSAWSEWAELTVGDQIDDWVLLNGMKRGN